MISCAQKKYLLLKILSIVFLVSCEENVFKLGTNTEEQKIQIQEEEWYLMTEDGESNLYIKEVGTGTPVIVLHGGFGNDHTNVSPVSNGLESKYKFIFYDQRGSSLSYCKPEAITVENHVKDLETLRKALGLEKITIVSHSAATILSFLYLEKYPERVQNTILLGAMELKSGNTEAHFRSIINRAYYGAFGHIRNKLGIYVFAASVHQAVINTLIRSVDISKKKAGKRLETLFKKRKDADYNHRSQIKGHNCEFCINEAKEVIRLFDS